jgi:curved DNA-binding protein CbpA
MGGLDYYRILQIQPDAPAPLVHTSYQTLVRRALRDSPGGDAIARLDAAYAVLSDPQRRAAYDLERASRDGARGPTAEPGTCLFCGEAHGIRGELKRDDECRRCASPLYPAERHRLEYSGQRILGRVQVRHAISIWTTWHRDTPIVGETHNLSLNGMAFSSSLLFEVNQIVRVDCTELRALGRIAHAEQATSGAHPFSAGLEFLTLRLPEGGGTFYASKK